VHNGITDQTQNLAELVVEFLLSPARLGGRAAVPLGLSLAAAGQLAETSNREQQMPR
jgi:hypothetical protein